jgi:hypothetical protein
LPEPLINRKTGSSKTYINQLLIGVFDKRVIFRAIDIKVAFRNFSGTFVDFALSSVMKHAKKLDAKWGLYVICRDGS